LTAAAVLLAALPAIVLGLVLARGGRPKPPAERGSSEPVAEELIMQPQYAPGSTAAQTQSASPKTVDLTALLPKPDKQSPFSISAAAKQWTADKMHEKINGEDVVYIDAGCLGLAAMTLANASGTETIDLLLFRMTSANAAGEVFADQAPDAAAPKPADRPNYVDLGDKAYTSYGSCYLRAGEFYLKVIVTGESKTAFDTALNLARKFAEERK